MKKELLRYQRLAGIITESQYTKKLNEGVDENELYEAFNEENIPENIKLEARNYILNLFKQCQTKISNGDFLEDPRTNGLKVYTKNGIPLFVDDLDSFNKIKDGGKSTLLMSSTILYDFEKEIANKLKIDLSSDENYKQNLGINFTMYFRELCGEIFFELYKRKVDNTYYGGHYSYYK